jgi:hypothetical protein
MSSSRINPRQTFGIWWWLSIIFIIAITSLTAVFYFTGLEDVSRHLWLVGGVVAAALGAYLSLLRSKSLQ